MAEPAGPQATVSAVPPSYALNSVSSAGWEGRAGLTGRGVRGCCARPRGQAGRGGSGLRRLKHPQGRARARQRRAVPAALSRGRAGGRVRFCEGRREGRPREGRAARSGGVLREPRQTPAASLPARPGPRPAPRSAAMAAEEGTLSARLSVRSTTAVRRPPSPST